MSKNILIPFIYIFTSMHTCVKECRQPFPLSLLYRSVSGKKSDWLTSHVPEETFTLSDLTKEKNVQKFPCCKCWCQGSLRSFQYDLHTLTNTCLHSKKSYFICLSACRKSLLLCYSMPKNLICAACLNKAPVSKLRFTWLPQSVFVSEFCGSDWESDMLLVDACIWCHFSSESF